MASNTSTDGHILANHTNDVMGQCLPISDIEYATAEPKSFVEKCKLARLPSEIRLLIYSFLFEGSPTVLHFRKFADPGRRAILLPLSLCRATSTDKSNYNLLKADTFFLCDASPTYWQNTILKVLSVDNNQHMDDLVKVLPPVVLRNVRHLRRINIRSSSSSSVYLHPERSIENMLDCFGKLATCELEGMAQVRTVLKESTDTVCGDEHAALWRASLGENQRSLIAIKHGTFQIDGDNPTPINWLHTHFGVPKNTKVQFLTSLFSGALYLSKKTYKNYTQGTYCEVKYEGYRLLLDDEVGFNCTFHTKEA